MTAGNAWGCLLCSIMQDIQGFDGDRMHAARETLPLAMEGGPLAQGMDMVAEALAGVSMAPADRSGSFRRMLSMVVYAPSRMVKYGTVPDDPVRVATMAALAGMAEAVPGSSAQKSDARRMGRTGPVSAWGYDGPDLSAGFIRSLITDTWVMDLMTAPDPPKTRKSISEPEPPAFPVELVASITGGRAPERADILRAESLEHASDLPYHNGEDAEPPGSPLPMDADTLEGTAGLRGRMGDAWPMIGVLRGRSWHHPFIPSMADMGFIIRDMDWSLPVTANGPGLVILSFLDAMEDGGDGFRQGWLSGHALASWSASLHDPPMMAATPAAAAHVDRIAGMFAKGLDDLITDGGCDDAKLDAAALDADTMRGLALLQGMPDGFLTETVTGILHERMNAHGRH